MGQACHRCAKPAFTTKRLSPIVVSDPLLENSLPLEKGRVRERVKRWNDAD
jgi:hypothetical protein